MQIVIPSYNRPTGIRTVQYLRDSGIKNFKVILHDDAQADEYIKVNPSLKKHIVVSNAPRGIQNQRTWIENSLIKKGEWYISMDDDIEAVNAVPDKIYYNQDILDVQSKTFDRKVFEQKLSAMDLIHRMEKNILRMNVNLIGVASVYNYFFLGKKHRYVGIVLGGIFAEKNGSVSLEDKVPVKEDYQKTAEHLLQFGAVLVDNWIVPVTKMYTEGGVGSKKDRMPKMIQASKYLMEKYPGLFRYKSKAGFDENAEIQLRLTSSEQVAKWRAEMYSQFPERFKKHG